ncbi:MAG: hypothetical protein RI910_2748, partial [Verrucomicrobiota bacterium]
MRLTLLPLALLALSASAADYFPPSDAQGGWRVPKDANEARTLAGVDMDKLEQAYRAVERSNTENGGLVVISKGYLVFEKYFGKARRNANPDMASTGKGFTSIACGVMLHEFKAKLPQGLDTKVYTQEFLPEAFPLRDPREADIRLGHLLCMTSGHNGEGATPTG